MDVAISKPIQTTGAQGFLAWLKRYQPDFYAAIRAKLPAGLAGFGLTAEGAAAPAATTGASPSWLSTLQNVLVAAAQAKLAKDQIDAQKDLWRIQLERAQAGLAPLDIDPATMGLPGPSVSVGLTGDTKKMLLWGGIGLAAFLILPKLLRRA